MKCIKENGKYRIDTVFYLIGKIIFIPFCLFGFWFAQTGFEAYGSQNVCAIRELCGLPCPGCGGTRAFYYLFKGDLWKSFYMNATVLYGVMAYLHFMLRMFYRRYINKAKAEEEVKIEYYLYGAVATILVQWLVKIIRIVHRMILL